MLCCTCVEQDSMGVRQCNGKFDGVVDPGLQWYCWPMGQITEVKTRVQQLDNATLTKTKDDVTVTVVTAVQWSVDPTHVEQFYFKMTNPAQQICSYVDDVIRSQLPIRDLDGAFAEKDAMGKAAEDTLRLQLAGEYGIDVLRVLITDLRPDANVLRAMNEINAAKRERMAAKERAEAQRILTVVNAEAEKDARQLSGQGLALMRREVASGFRNSIVDLTGVDQDATMSAQGVVHMMLVTQYLDVLKDFAGSGKASMVVPHGAGFVQDIEKQVRDGFGVSGAFAPGGVAAAGGEKRVRSAGSKKKGAAGAARAPSGASAPLPDPPPHTEPADPPPSGAMEAA